MLDLLLLLVNLMLLLLMMMLLLLVVLQHALNDQLPLKHHLLILQLLWRFRVTIAFGRHHTRACRFHGTAS
jgi:hypothetical protein